MTVHVLFASHMHSAQVYVLFQNGELGRRINPNMGKIYLILFKNLSFSDILLKYYIAFGIDELPKRTLRNCDVYDIVIALPNGRLCTIYFKCVKNTNITRNFFESRVRLDLIRTGTYTYFDRKTLFEHFSSDLKLQTMR